MSNSVENRLDTIIELLQKLDDSIGVLNKHVEDCNKECIKCIDLVEITKRYDEIRGQFTSFLNAIN